VAGSPQAQRISEIEWIIARECVGLTRLCDRRIDAYELIRARVVVAVEGLLLRTAVLERPPRKRHTVLGDAALYTWALAGSRIYSAATRTRGR
jgi:hypothetical protein